MRSACGLAMISVVGLLVGCPEQATEKPPASSPRATSKCLSDIDCGPDRVCMCVSDACSVEPRMQIVEGSAEGKCLPRSELQTSWIPSRVDGGWTIEAERTGAIYRSSDEAWRRAVERPVEHSR